MPTLFVSDLDGTLLNSNSQVSDFSAKIINRLTAQDILFSVATARSIGTAFDKIKPLHIRIPFCLMNGVFLYYKDNLHPVDICPFPKEAAITLLRESLRIGASPFLYQYLPTEQKMELQYFDLNYPPREQFYQMRKDSAYKKLVKVHAPYFHKEGIPVYINFLDEYNILQRVNGIVRNIPGVQSVFYHDPVLNAWYLEVFSSEAGKAAGVRRLAEIVHANRIVAFGDNDNDLSMFEIADECYATSNAPQVIQNQADGVIPSCDEDGVARFLAARFPEYF